MDKIIQRMENLPSDPRKDNPLKIMGDEDGEDPTVAADMDAVIALSSSSKFSVYNDIKQKLLDKGIPA